jgi:3-deoxy-manno-octulosonate cytidylyltransferase (CMP-KDO synthetase)
MTSVGIIPARYAASRFEGKVIANIGGKTMIQHVWERAKKAHSLDDLIVAADDDRIIKVVESFGGKAVFTSKSHPSGTDRLREIANPLDVDIVVNIQADEPLLHHSMIDNLVDTMCQDKNIVMASLMRKLDSISDLENPNIVKVVVDKNNFALYFSRSPIPFLRDRQQECPEYGDLRHLTGKLKFYKHIGLYAYTKDFLFTFANLPQSSLEQCEKLEQLRALENGYKIMMVETKYDTIGVDTSEDLDRARAMLARGRSTKPL